MAIHRYIFFMHNQEPWTCGAGTPPESAFCGELITLDELHDQWPTVPAVHHIDGDPDNNDPANLTLAHAACHARHHGKDPRRAPWGSKKEPKPKEPRALSEREQRAARMLGSGRRRNDVAAEVGVNPGTVSRWGSRPDFQQAIELARLHQLAENPGVRPMLIGALAACDNDGHPDWKTRIAAARELRAWQGVSDPEPTDDGGPAPITYHGEDDDDQD